MPGTTIPSALTSFPAGGVAVVFGAGGGIGGALVDALQASGRFSVVLGFGRTTAQPVDILDDTSLEAAAASAAAAGEIRLVLDATGFLHDDLQEPEKSWRQLDADKLARSYAINAIAPALMMKTLLPRLPRTGKAVFGTLSARVGSIGDNFVGGWYAYRASKAALNQLVRTASIELARRAPEAICVAMHPGTVATTLSAPFGSGGHQLFTPAEAAAYLLTVVDGLTAAQSGGFFDWQGEVVPY
ncbi:SDR family NAD(P)-dependent oxidoreductase [Devosia sp.]|jgi:NAD(P)-dependent dehydrogenase (short-subunit alcohol dehydrogenase family)|uniref:SDR family NAD(P)-dependent oxidoreductase n=1 Tax=Devosia sp. TaxID=1871048 RepID=UPI0037BF6C89